MILIRTFRSLMAMTAGIMLISLVAEAIEFGLVTMINGAMTTDPESYFAIRNRGWFLCVKLIYNTAAAVAGGYAAAWIAGDACRKAGTISVRAA